MNSSNSLIRFLAAGMELCCLWLWLAVINSFLGFGNLPVALMLAPYAVPLLANLVSGPGDEGTLGRTLNTVLSMLIITATGFLAFQRVLAGESLGAGWSGYPGIGLQMGLGAASWWIGQTFARREPTLTVICTRFQIGVMSMFFLSLLNRDIFLPVILFFILAFLALPLARWEASASRSGAVLIGTRTWPVIAGGAAALVPALFLFLMFSPQAARAVQEWLAALFSNLFSFIKLDQPPPPPEPSSPVSFWGIDCSAPRSAPATQETPKAATFNIPPIVMVLGVFAIFAGAFLLVLLASKKSRPKGKKIRRPDFEASSLRLGLLHWLAAVFQAIGSALWRGLRFLLRLGRRKRMLPGPQEQPATSIRALYASLLRWAAGQGLPRSPSQTPLEYLQSLSVKFPQNAAELAAITDAYVTARYGNAPIGWEMFEAARTAWRKITWER